MLAPTSWYGMQTDSLQHESKRRLLDAALYVIRTKGYTAARVEDICEAAGLTKGSFFHHFKSKEDLALAAAERWNDLSDSVFRAAPYQSLEGPRERLLAYIDFRRALLQGNVPEFTCLAGTIVQEVYETHPAICEAYAETINRQARTLEQDIAQAMRVYGATPDWTPLSLAMYVQAVLQGAFTLAKAGGGAAPAVECLGHLRRHFEMLFPDGASNPH